MWTHWSVDSAGDVDIERDSDVEDEEDDDEKDEKEEEMVDEGEEEKNEDEDEDVDEDEDNGKEPWMIGQGEMVNSSADDVDTMVDDQPTVLHEQGQEICKHTPWPQPLVPALWPQSPEPCP